MSKQSYGVNSDPKRQHEAQKYQNPIPSREVILKYLNDLQRPTVFENIANALELHSKEQLLALAKRLGAMVREAQLNQNQRYFYPFGQPEQIITGEVRIRNDGSGFIATKGKTTKPYLPISQVRLVFDGDIVCAVILGINRKHKLEARIDSIVKRNTHEIIGRYRHQLDAHVISPISKTLPKNILLMPPTETLEPNTLIKAKLIIQPSHFGPAVAKFAEIIEEQSPILTAISIASKKHNLLENWAPKTLKSVEKLAAEVQSSEIQERNDLRTLPFVTIDGEDAKDFDDAVYAHKSTTGGWKLYVAIADVSYYVRPNTKLDSDARKRSTSVYFPGYVIPMLPEKLSNELCSLKPNVDRLALVCEMNISKKAKLTRYKFYSAVINSKARLTYTEVGRLLSNQNNTVRDEHPHLIPQIFELHSLYQVLAKARAERGAIDFDTVETQILLDSHQHIASIVPRHRNVAHRLIEECMLLANVASARFVEKHNSPNPFRVHQPPTDTKVRELQAYLKTLGIHFPAGEAINPKTYAQMLENAKDRDDFNNIQLMVLKSMNQAVYTPDNAGHFGLAYEAYTHFTSPIRRYPDLLTHRTIKSILKEKKFGAKKYTAAELDELCAHASTQERNADVASLEVEKWLKCHFLQDRIGEIFDATIMHVTGFGFFVELTENYIQGLVHIASISGDYYIFDDVRHRLIGERSKTIYTIGQKVRVRLVRTDLEGGYIDFELATQDIEGIPSSRKFQRNKGKGRTFKQVGKAKKRKSAKIPEGENGQDKEQAEKPVKKKKKVKKSKAK